jgi:Skp family chaperone for outer membrane proteins
LRHILILPLIALLGLFVSVPQPHAQQTQPPKAGPAATAKPGVKERLIELDIPFPVAVLDVGTILRDASAVKDIQEQINKYGMKYEEEIEKQREEIRNANQELARQRTILSPDAFAERRRQFEQRVVEVQQLVQQRQRELDTSRNDAMSKVNDAYIKIVSQIAVDRKLALILRKDQTAFSSRALDVTEEILTQLNNQLPKVAVQDPGKKVAKPGK